MISNFFLLDPFFQSPTIRKIRTNPTIVARSPSSSSSSSNDYSLPFENTQNYNTNVISNDFKQFFQKNESFSSFFPYKLDKEVQTSFLSEETHVNSGHKRWIISFCDCLINISKYYCMDTPQALQTYFYAGTLSLSSLEYNFFYSIFAYFWIITFFSGYFLEKYGLRFTLFLFCVLSFIGHFFFTLGGSLENYVIMLLGRFIFGIGVFVLDLCQDLLIIEWFFDRELALALGLRFSTCRIGSALTIFFTPKIMVSGGYLDALSVGLFLSLIGIISSLIIVFVDRNYEEEKGDLENLESFLRDFSFIENGITMEKLKEMGTVFWLMDLNVFLAYAFYLGFMNNSNDILCSLYGYLPQEAGEVVTVMYFLAGFTPIFGLIVDRIGRRLNIMFILLILVALPVISLSVLPTDYSKNFIIFIGIFFSSYVSVIWSSFPLLIDGKKQILAFTIIYSTLNISMILGSMFVGISVDLIGDQDVKNQYKWAFLCMILCLVICFGLLVKIKNKGGKVVDALNSFVTNHEIRNIIVDDPCLGQRLLEMIENENGDKENKNSELFKEMQ